MRTKKNFLKLPAKTVDRLKLRLSKFVSADQFLWLGRATDDELQQLAANWPSLPAPAAFNEPKSHIRARQVLGKDFHGVAVAEKYFGAFSQKEREERKHLCLRDHRTGEFLSEEATLLLLEECKGHFVLCAVHPLDLCGIHAAQKARFKTDPDNPWFGYPEEREKFSGEANRDPWVLVRKSILPDSTRKTVEGRYEQRQLLSDLFPKERIVLPAEFAEVAIVHFGETGEKLAGAKRVRFFVRTAEALWLCVLWNGDQLDFDSYFDVANYNCGLLSARTS